MARRLIQNWYRLLNVDEGMVPEPPRSNIMEHRDLAVAWQLGMAPQLLGVSRRRGQHHDPLLIY